jgi:hypothetical protein
MQALINRLEGDPRFNVMAQSESPTRPADQSASRFKSPLFRRVGDGHRFEFRRDEHDVAAVARRSADRHARARLRAGNTSFFIESLLLSAIGGVLGCLLVLPLNNISTGIGSFVTFSEIVFNFRITVADGDRGRLRSGDGAIGISSRPGWPRTKRFSWRCGKVSRHAISRACIDQKEEF